MKKTVNLITQNLSSIITFLVTIAIYAVTFVRAWQKFSDKILVIEEKLILHDKVHVAIETKLNSVDDVRIKLASIQADLIWIREKLRGKKYD